MQDLQIIKNENGNDAVLCSTLYRGLGLKQSNYARWIKRNITNNRFAFSSQDYVSSSTLPMEEGKEDFILTIDFAKRLSMMMRTETGEKVRRYFLQCEKIAKNQTNQYLIELQTELSAWRGLEVIRLKRIEINREARTLRKELEKTRCTKNFTDFTNQLTLNFTYEN